MQMKDNPPLTQASTVAADSSDALDRIVAQWQSESVTDDLLPMALLGRIARLTKYIEAELSRCHSEFGLGQGEFDVLATLRRAGAPFTLTPSVLYQSMMLSSGAMTSRLDRLEKKALITRQHCTEDRRAVHVSLTPEGQSLIECALVQHLACQQALLAGVSQQERQLLSQILASWLKTFEPQS